MLAFENNSEYVESKPLLPVPDRFFYIKKRREKAKELYSKLHIATFSLRAKRKKQASAGKSSFSTPKKSAAMGIFSRKQKSPRESGILESQSTTSFGSSTFRGLANNRVSAGSMLTPNTPLSPMPSIKIPKIDLPRPPDPQLDPAGYLRSLTAVRERAKALMEKAQDNELVHFDVDMNKFPDVVTFVSGLIKVCLHKFLGRGSVKSGIDIGAMMNVLHGGIEFEGLAGMAWTLNCLPTQPEKFWGCQMQFIVCYMLVYTPFLSFSISIVSQTSRFKPRLTPMCLYSVTTKLLSRTFPAMVGISISV